MNAKRFGVILAILLFTALAGCAQQQVRQDAAPGGPWPSQADMSG